MPEPTNFRPTSPTSPTDDVATSPRAAKLVAAAAEAAEVRTYQTHLDVVALGVERIRRQVELMMWVGIVLGLAFTAVNVQQFAAAGAAHGSLGWWAAWLLDPMVSLVLLALLRAEQVTSRYLVEMGPWVRRARWFCLGSTYVMNTWEAWAAGVPSRIVLHSVPPLLVFAAAEAIAQARNGITQAVAVAVRGDQPPVVESTGDADLDQIPSPVPVELPAGSPGLPEPERASPASDDEVLDDLRELPGPLPKRPYLVKKYRMGSGRADRLLDAATRERERAAQASPELQGASR